MFHINGYYLNYSIILNNKNKVPLSFYSILEDLLPNNLQYILEDKYNDIMMIDSQIIQYSFTSPFSFWVKIEKKMNTLVFKFTLNEIDQWYKKPELLKPSYKSLAFSFRTNNLDNFEINNYVKNIRFRLNSLNFQPTYNNSNEYRKQFDKQWLVYPF